VNVVTVGALLKSFAPISVDRVQTPILQYAVSARDCVSWECCNSSQKRFYKDCKESGFPRRRGLSWRM